MTVAPIVHLCGWPGCGKRTIARFLRELLARHELLRLPEATTLVVTHLSPDAAARQIPDVVDA